MEHLLLTGQFVSCPASFAAYGVDGCRAGWFFVALMPSRKIRWGVVRTLEELLETASDSDRIFVDIPIGLLAGPGQRLCDAAAREVVGPRRSSVFSAPVREVFGATSFEDAQRLSQRVAGKGISKQAFAITQKIEQVDTLLRRCPRARNLIREVHPEVCFWALAGGRPMVHNKGKRHGCFERAAILKAVRPSAEDELSAISASYPRRMVARDDAPDAMAAALTAAQDPSMLRTLPAAPPLDRHGLPMEMVFARGAP